MLVKNKILHLFIVLILLSAFQVSAVTKKVLFIGDRLTGTNNMSKMIADMASSTGDSLIYLNRTPISERIKDHSTDANTLNLIAQGDWDYVVLQENGQFSGFVPLIFQAETYQYIYNIDSIITAQNLCTQVLLFQNWGFENGDIVNCPFQPHLCTYEGMDSVIKLNIYQTAKDLQVSIAPVGVVWRAIRDAYYPAMQPYGANDNPSVLGTYIAASSFYTMIFEKDPTAVTYHQNLNASDADTILSMTKSLVYDSMASFRFIDSSAPTINNIFINSLTQGVSQATIDATNGDLYLWIIGTDTIAIGVEALLDSGIISSGTELTVLVYNCFGSDTLSVPLGLDDIGQSDVQIYPNPVTDQIHVGGTQLWSKWEVYDMLGRLQDTGLMPSDRSIRLDLNPGFYIFHLWTMDDRHAVNKITVE